MALRRSVISVFVMLCVSFVVYSIILHKRKEAKMSEQVKGDPLHGKTVWQNYNCQACHQLYGLGGYLGPDLTNVMSKYYNNRAIVKSFIVSGNASMPSYKMSEKDLEALIDFLGYMTTTGEASPKKFKRLPSGMIE